MVFAGFSRVFSCDFINFLHRLTGLDVDKTLPLRARARARRATLDMRPFSSSFHLGGIAGVRSLSIKDKNFKEVNQQLTKGKRERETLPTTMSQSKYTKSHSDSTVICNTLVFMTLLLVHPGKYQQYTLYILLAFAFLVTR